ncbi:MAG TPA: hypothetical protein GX708_21080 [Gallicola sp.]|nr:hypothetical protein [Gallicola sp.]
MNIDNEGINYINQELELDAFAFTKFYLEKYENISVKSKIEKLDKYINDYIEIAKKNL